VNSCGKVEFCLTKLQALHATSSTFAALHLVDVLNAFGLFARTQPLPVQPGKVVFALSSHARVEEPLEQMKSAERDCAAEEVSAASQRLHHEQEQGTP